MAARRQEAILALGGKCVRCGSDQKLHFDHIDRSKKVSHRIWSWAPERIKKELEKCQLLCFRCHVSKTIFELYGALKHGIRARYDAGCRCGDCRHAKALSMRDYRLKRKNSTNPTAHQELTAYVAVSVSGEKVNEIGSA